MVQTTPATQTPATDSRSGERALVFAAILTGLLLTFAAYSPQFTSRPLIHRPGEAPAYRVDLNRADRAELMQVPGIGAGKADAILAQRKAGGEFATVNDLSKVKGIGAKTVDQLKQHVIVDGSTVLPKEPESAPPSLNPPAPPSSRPATKHQPNDAPLNVNTASEAELQRLPGVGRVLAERIIAARPFVSVDDLQRVKGIGTKTLEKLKNFVVVK